MTWIIEEPQGWIIEDEPTGLGADGQNFAAGVGKAVADAGRGVKQMLDVPALALERMFGPVTLGGRLPTAAASAAATEADIAESRRLDAPLMDTKAGLAGTLVGNVALAAPTAMIPGANTVTGAALVGGGLGAVQPVAGDESRLVNAAIGAGSSAAGQVAGQKIAQSIAGRVASRTAEAKTAAAQNAVRDATLAASREAGYVVPPVQTRPTVVNRALEGLAGKLTTAQAASVKNQRVTNDLARRALGIADDAPLNVETLNAIRAEAGKAYEAIKGAGIIKADSQYADDLARITSRFTGASKDFPDLAKNEIGDVIASVNKPEFSADSALDAIAILRDKAAKAGAAGDKGTAKAYRSASLAMEDAIERNLMERGDKGLLKGFQEARRMIAKTYTVEKALNPATGNVSGPRLAQQLAKGKPLSGDLRRAAEFAQAFPKAAQDVTSSMPGISPLDYAAAAGIGAAGSGPLALSALVARPAVRSMILSGPFQRMPEYRISDLLRLSAALAPTGQRIAPGLGAASGLAYGAQE